MTLFCKEIQSRFSPVVQQIGKSYFGYFIIENTLYEVFLSKAVISDDRAKYIFNHFLVSRYVDRYLAKYRLEYCPNCSRGGSFEYINQKLRCVYCGLNKG